MLSKAWTISITDVKDDIFALIQVGDRLRVDGSQGTIEILG
jgi:hypothetical protein